jgi:hypothetical protein
MKRPSARRRPGTGDEAISTVLGAILLFGLLVSTLVTIQVQYVPVWDHQRESRLMDEVSGQLAMAQSALGHEVSNRSRAPVALPVALSPPGGFSFFTGSTQPGVASFKPSGTGLALRAPNGIRIESEDGVDLSVLDEQWKTAPMAPATETVDDIASLQHFRVRVLDPTLPNKGVWSFTATLEHEGVYAGKLVLSETVTSSEYSFRTQVFGSKSQTDAITDVTDAWKKTTSQKNPYYIDALERTLGFAAVLSAAEKPATLTWSNAIPGLQTALVKTSYDTGAASGSGNVVANYLHEADGGRIEVARENQRFPSQAYTLEYGALILDQPEGSAMVAPPALSVRQAAGVVKLAWTVPELTGSASSVAGARGVQLAAQPVGGRMELHGVAPRIEVTLDTTHATVWNSYWKAVFDQAGLKSPANYEISPPTPTQAKLIVYGMSTSATAEDVHVDYEEATLAVSLLPTG